MFEAVVWGMGWDIQPVNDTVQQMLEEPILTRSKIGKLAS